MKHTQIDDVFDTGCEQDRIFDKLIDRFKNNLKSRFWFINSCYTPSLLRSLIRCGHRKSCHFTISKKGSVPHTVDVIYNHIDEVYKVVAINEYTGEKVMQEYAYVNRPVVNKR